MHYIKNECPVLSAIRGLDWSGILARAPVHIVNTDLSLRYRSIVALVSLSVCSFLDSYVAVCNIASFKLL